MLGSIWLEISSIVEIFSVIFAIPNNLLLLFCIFHKSPKKFGNYRFLMAFFTYQSMWFSCITLFLNVNYFTFETSISIFVRRNLLGLPDMGMMILTSLACSSNCMMFVALAVQFVYRYFAMTKSSKLSLFNSWRMSVWYFAMILVSLFFGITVFICGCLLEKGRFDGFKKSLFSTFELSENSTFYYARMTYYTRDSQTGAIVLDWCSLGCLFLLVLSITPVSVMIYCGVRTYRRMSKATSQLSNHMKLQKELFQALLIQSTIPCIFLFLPSLTYFIFPIFNLELGLFSNIAGITFVIYPVLDPLAVIYVIKHYRCYVFKLFCLSHKVAPKNAQCVSNEMAVVTTTQETNNEKYTSFNSISAE